MHQNANPTRAVTVGAAWLALVTGVVTLVTFGIAYTTPPRSGPFCTAGCVPPPYTDAAQFVPRDYLWMYGAIVVTLLFLALVVSLESRAAIGRWVLARTSVAVATIAATALVLDYGIQLSVVQPLLARGEAGGIGFLTQYHPQGVFIGLENIGYAAMALAFVLAGLAIVPTRPVQRVVRWTLLLGGLATLASLVVLGLTYGADLDYRFEVAAISLTWLTLVISAGAIVWQYRRISRSARTRR